MTREESLRNDLFQSTFIELHHEAPAELVRSLRESLDHIRTHNPQSAQTAEACLRGLASDGCTLLHVLTAAYLINGGVMLKHHTIDAEKLEEEAETDPGFDFKDLEEELNRFSEPTPPPIKSAAAQLPPAPTSRRNTRAALSTE